MNPNRFTARCNVCGGLGKGTFEVAEARWLGGRVRHENPAVCAYNLEKKRIELEKRECALNEHGLAQSTASA